MSAHVSLLVPLVVLNSAANPINNCRYNEKYVLHVLRLKQRESKANLARLTGLTAAAVGGIIKSLEEKGLVENVGKLQGDMGQPATLYALAPEGAYGIGVSVNRGDIETVIINFVGEVVASRKHPMILPAPEAVLAMVLEDIDELADSLLKNISFSIAGVGVAQPYYIGSWSDDNQGWKAWDDFDLAAALSKKIGLPAFTQNDANAGAIAELIYGKEQDSKDFLYIFFGSPLVQSLGGGLVLNGECRNGAHGNAGDIGQFPMPVGSIPTSVARQGEQMTALAFRSSLNSLVKHLRASGEEIQSRDQFKQAIERKSFEVDQWLDDCLDGLEMAVFGIQGILDVPEIVVDCEDEDAELVSKIINGLGLRLGQSSASGMELPILRKGNYGSQAGAIGAATLPLDSTFSPKL